MNKSEEIREETTITVTQCKKKLSVYIKSTTIDKSIQL